MNKKQILKFTSIPFLIALTLFATSKYSSFINNKVISTTNNIYKRPSTVTSTSAKQLLIEGNKRFVSDKVLPNDLSYAKRINLAIKGQYPFAVVLSCSDSRVPPELVFNQGLGDIFVVRNAGNVVDAVTLGSIEYGAEHLGVPLIVVMGHEKCGAVIATVNGGHVEGSIVSIIEKITPSFEKIKSTSSDKNVLYEKCTDENINNSIEEIKKSPVISKLLAEKKIEIVGAKYHIQSGEVTFSKGISSLQ